MKLNHFLILNFTVFGALSFIPSSAFSYAVETHGFLTKEVFDFYNKSFPEKKIPEEFRDYLVDGARDEDNNLRSMNHFYDPVFDRGLDNDGYTGEKSKAWVEDRDYQSSIKYKLMPRTIIPILSLAQIVKVEPLYSLSDFTWQSAIEFYVQGKIEKAFFTLGHVLHLIEDSAVPDHTRNDPHPPWEDGGSPYENWASRFNLDNLDLGLPSRLNGKSPISLPTLGDYFDSMARYSNNNFYSRDSLTEYQNPVITSLVSADQVILPGYFYGILTNNDGDSYRLILGKKQNSFSWRDTISDNSFSLVDQEINGNITPGYWSRLSVKVVQHAAGVIDLFFKEAEKAKNDPNFHIEGDRTIAQMLSGIGEDIVIGAASLVEGVVSATANTISNIGDFFSDIFSSDSSSALDPLKFSQLAQVISAEETASEIPNTQEINNILSGSDILVGISNFSGDPSNEPYQSDNPNTSDGSSNGEDTTTIITNITNPSLFSDSFSSGGGSSSHGDDPIYGGSGSSAANTSSTDSGGDSISSSSSPGDAGGSGSASVPAILNPNYSVISEIQLTGGDGRTHEDFIELYNPTGVAIDLGGWKLRKRTQSGAESSIRVFPAGSRIAAHGYFLWANSENSFSAAIGADVSSTASLAANNSAALLDAGGSVIDAVSWGENLVTPFSEGDSLSGVLGVNQSFERKSLVSGACVNPDGAQEFSGNGCDTDNNQNDFVVRLAAAAQSGSDLSEPRLLPATPSSGGVPNIVTYDATAMSINLAWQPSSDAAGNTAGVIYSVLEYNSPGIEVYRGPATSFSKTISEVGRDYHFSVQAIDKNGLASDLADLVVSVPGIFDILNFFRDAATGKPKLDIHWPAFPKNASAAPWQTVIFYLNRAPENIPALYSEQQFATLPEDSRTRLYGEWGIAAPNALAISYRKCDSAIAIGNALIIPDSDVRCNALYPGVRSRAMHGSYLEDHFISLPVLNDRVFSPSDYVTVAFYSYQPLNTQALVAIDSKEYFFSEIPSVSQLPTAPKDITFSYSRDVSPAVVDVSWESSTDPDTVDASITYEWSVDGGIWQSLGVTGGELGRRTGVVSLDLGRTYDFRIRASDDRGNKSPALNKELILLPATICPETAATNSYFAIDCVQVEDGLIKISWRLLANPGEVFGIIPFAVGAGAANNDQRAVHKNLTGNANYPYTTARANGFCNANITSIDSYQIGKQYRTVFSSISGKSGTDLLGQKIKFSIFRGEPCGYSGAPFFTDDSEYLVTAI